MSEDDWEEWRKEKARWEYWKNVAVPSRYLLTSLGVIIFVILWLFGLLDVYGKTETILIIAIPILALHFVIEYYMKKRLKREREELKKIENEILNKKFK